MEGIRDQLYATFPLYNDFSELYHMMLFHSQLFQNGLDISQNFLSRQIKKVRKNLKHFKGYPYEYMAKTI